MQFFTPNEKVLYKAVDLDESTNDVEVYTFLKCIVVCKMVALCGDWEDVYLLEPINEIYSIEATKSKIIRIEISETLEILRKI